MTAQVTKHLPLVAGAPDGIKKLRDLVLELAVCGRLLAQDESDEPADLLIDRIEALKASRISSGAVKRQKAATQSTVQSNHPIPESWRFVQLGDVVEIVRGITFPASEKSKEPSPGRIACLRTANVQSQIEWDDLLYIDESFVSREDQFLQPNDIVMSMANSRELVGKVALVGEEPLQRSTFGGFLGVLRPYLIEPRFVMSLLRTPSARSALIDSASQTTNIANISLAKLRPLMVALPPLAEQHRIVAKVDELMALCDRLEADQADAEAGHAQLVQALLDSLTQATDAADFRASWQRLSEHFHTLFTTEASIDALKQTVLQLAVMGKLAGQSLDDEPAEILLSRIQKHKKSLVADGALRKPRLPPEVIPASVPYELPRGWTWVRWESVTLKIGDIDHKMPETTTDGIPFVSPRDFYPGNVIDFDGAKRVAIEDYERLSAKIKAERGDLIYPRYGTIGENVIVDVDRDFLVSYSCAVVKVAKGFIDPMYQYYCSLSACIRRQAKAAENKTTQANVGIKSIQEFLFPLPPLAEQHRIVAKVDELMALCDQLKAGLAESRQLHGQLAAALVEQAVA